MWWRRKQQEQLDHIEKMLELLTGASLDKIRDSTQQLKQGDSALAAAIQKNKGESK